MKIYEFGLKHDVGLVKIRVNATDIETAKKIVLDVERAPESAIQYWAIVPTQKQINKTKSILRNI